MRTPHYSGSVPRCPLFINVGPSIYAQFVIPKYTQQMAAARGEARFTKRDRSLDRQRRCGVQILSTSQLNSPGNFLRPMRYFYVERAQALDTIISDSKRKQRNSTDW